MNFETLNFAKFDGSKQLIWDASSLDSFKRCPRYYQYNVLQGWRPKEPPEQLIFGTALHAGLEAYDHARLRGVKRWDATVEGMQHALKAGEVLKASKDTARTPETLTRAIVWYAEQFDDDPATLVVLPNGHPAIEVRFEVAVPGTAFRFSGRIDKIVELGGEIYVVERKTTSTALGPYYFNRYSPNTQVSAYCWALREFCGLPISGVMIEAFQTGVTFTRIERNIVRRSEDQLNEFLRNTAMLLNHADEYHKADYYPMNESACMLYGGCSFREVCERPASRRKAWLEEDFELRPYKR